MEQIYRLFLYESPVSREIGEKQRENCVRNYLEKKGYEINSKPYGIIRKCDDWYANREQEFHRRKTVQGTEYKMSRMNFVKRCCSDDANLCEIVSVTPEEENSSKEFIDDLLRRNRFDVKYREQLEKLSAVGTAAAYIYLKNAQYLSNGHVRGGEIRINYVDADCYIPLTVENGEVTEAAFSASNLVKGEKRTTLVIFTVSENGLYTAETVNFDKNGAMIGFGSSVQLGNIKPFSIMMNAEVNNIDDMTGYGLPKVYGTIPIFETLDLCYNVLYSDLDKAEKIVLINEMLCKVTDNKGNPVLTPEQKKIFLILGERLPDEKTLYQEHSPEIRIEQITKCFELVLSLISLSFGYGTKKYTFENGQIKTATEYIGERQDAMQELNKQRRQAVQYITGIIRAAMWFSNTFQGSAHNPDEILSIQFDDSYIEDKQTSLEAMRMDAISFPEVPWLKFTYIKTKYNLSDEDAKKYIIEEGLAFEQEEEETTD